MTHSFDFDKALEDLQSGKDLTGKGGILMPLIKQLTEAAITAELNHHLSSNEHPNRKNGTSSKTHKQVQEHLSLMPHEIEQARLSLS